MNNNIKKTDLNKQAVANANELLNTEEPPTMTTYLWCKIQTMAESLINQNEKRIMDRDLMINREIYKSIMNNRRFDRRVMRMLIHQN
jgi:hypothetical protein